MIGQIALIGDDFVINIRPGRFNWPMYYSLKMQNHMKCDLLFPLPHHSPPSLLPPSSVWRNPDFKERPTFGEICQMLQAVEASILMTYKEDRAKSQMGNLGAALKDSFSLYKELQETYTKTAS